MKGQEEIPGMDPEHGLFQGAPPCNILDCFENVGPGWHGLLEEAHQLASGIDPSYQVIQVREKFGGLDIYLSGMDDIASGELWNAMSPFWNRSRKVCELCGGEGSPRVNRKWIKTWCDDCQGAYEETRLIVMNRRERAAEELDCD